MKPVTVSIVKQALAPRPDDAHKGTMGTLLSICGCYGMAGACLLSSKAALRSGIGLLKCALPKSIYPIAAVSIWESVYLPLEETPDGKTAAANLPFLRDQAADAVLMGCGMSVCDDTRTLVRGFLEACDKPLLLDADALNCLADDPSVLRRVKAPVIITPHPAEMGRLLGVSAGEVNADREMTAKRFAADYGVIVVLKGAGTVTAAPDGRAVINTTGNSGMATGGSGDVLAGICASLLAQGGEAFDSAAAAVYLHGLAGDLAAARLGKISMLPTDLLDALPQAFLSVQRSGKER
ncbi:MAG: NAD(P)H-hydrate dehydratase [Ruminococcus sp.]|nr:NAD(P)H-hydrate dehydratase [Ruminococcus sp.]